MAGEKMVTVVVPFLNEEENLPELYRRLAAALAGQPEQAEFLFVDDGSRDGGPAWLAARAREDARVKVLRLSRNFGHQIAITAGLDHARGDAVVIIDADLQDPPELLPELLAKWREGFEVVYAVRRSRQGETWLKKFLAAAFYKVFRAMSKVDAPLNAGDFRLLDRCVVDAMRELREQHRFMRGLTCWVGFNQGQVLYDRDARFAGETKYPIWKSARLAFDAITSFSALPLRWTTGLGFITCVVAALWGLQIIIGTLMAPGSNARGWASIMAAVVFMGGVQLISIGILGQYLGRTFEETKRRPLYFLRREKTPAPPVI